MASRELTYEVQNRVGIVRFSRAPVNAVRHEDLDALRELLESLPKADELAVVLTTGGETAFLAGHDISEFVDCDLAKEEERAERYISTLRTVYNHPLVTVAAVDGPAMGGGTIIASLCDVCITSPDASFALAEINVGIIGGYAPLRRVLPEGVARHMLYSGEPISGQRAYELGMAALLDDNPKERAIQYAEDVASKSPEAVQAARSLVRDLQSLDPILGYRRERDYVAILRQYSNTDEAAQAFLADREPDFGEGHTLDIDEAILGLDMNITSEDDSDCGR